MATKNMNASAAIGGSGGETKVQCLIISGEHATAIGSVTLKTGGTGGTVKAGPFYVSAGDCQVLPLPMVVADYVTIDNAVAFVSYIKPYQTT